MCHGLDVAGQGSGELLYRRQSGTPGVINEAIKLCGIGAAELAAEPHLKWSIQRGEIVRG
jgi:hypothetical protein